MRKNVYRCFALILMMSLLTACANTGRNPNVDSEKESQFLTESESMSETEEKEPEPVVSTITITATGDCALGALQYHAYSASFHEYYDAYGETYFFKNFKEVFEKDDMTLINLECVFTNAADRVEKEFSIKGKPSYNGILSSSSIEVVTLGNNHSSDYGPESLEDTKKSVEEVGVSYAINDSISYYTTTEGFVIAVVSASVTGSGNARDQYLLNGVTEARNQGADIVIACPHWGIERENYPNNYQRNLGHALIDQGADLVIGNHPHTLQGAEEYKGKMIMYSLGNFSFGANRNPADKDTVVYQQTFTFIDGVLQSDITAKVIPARVSGYDGYNNYQPKIAEGDQAKNILNRLNEYSAAYGDVSFDENGNLLIKTKK